MVRCAFAVCLLVVSFASSGWAQLNNVTIGDNSIADWADEVCIDDPDGCNDVMGQRDIQRACIASNFGTTMPADTLYLLQLFDETGTSGANTIDGCWLIDLDTAGAGDGLADLALCVTTEMNPAVLQSASLFDCNDSNNDRCGGPVSRAAPSLSCSVVQNVAECNGAGTGIECSDRVERPRDSAPATVIELLAGCSFPSGNANSAPADCAFESPGETVDTTTGNSTPVELLDFIVR